MPVIETYFPTHVYVEERIDNFVDVQKEMKECVKNVEFSFHEKWGTHYLTDLNFQSDLLHKMPVFSKELSKHIEQYCNTMKFYEKTRIEVVSSWFSKFLKGNHGHIHNHKGSDISGVYYHQTSGDDGNIFFTTPNPFTEVGECWSSVRHNHEPKEGKLLIFPGWLRHGITTNLTNNIRISFSFNLKVHEWANE